MNMVEKVARAICDKEEPDGLGNWEFYRDHARAAIEAMREPTDAMLRAGAIGSGEDSENTASGAWDSMIAVALFETTNEPA